MGAPLVIPKLWDGPTAVGERKMSALENVDTPYLTAYSGNATSYKRGLFREVHNKKPGLDGWFSLGQIQPGVNADAPTYFVGSFTGIGTFSQRGIFGTKVDVVAPQLQTLWSGQTTVTVLSPYSGGAHPITQIDIYRGRGAYGFSLWVTYYVSSTGFQSFAPALAPARALNENNVLDRVCVVATMLIDETDTWFPAVYVYRNGFWEPSFGVLGYPAHRHGIPNLQRALPSTVVMFVPTVATPGQPFERAFLEISTDNGINWGTVADSTFIEAVVGDGITPPYGDFPNGRAADTFSVLPRDSENCFILANKQLPFEVGVPYRPLVVGILNIPSTTVTSVWTVTDLPHNEDLAESYRVLKSPTKSHEFWCMLAVDLDHPELPPILVRTEDFVTFEQTTLGWEAQYVGALSAFDERTLLLSVYEGGNYVMYQSKDDGITWTKRATLRANTPPPEFEFGFMQRFGVVTVVSRDGLPAPARPDVPWAVDASHPAPTP